MITSRRWFLGGLLTAPAIVRIGSIMPAAELAIFQPELLVPRDGLLTMEIITREALRIFKNSLALAGTYTKAIPIIAKVGFDRRQSHVDLQMSNQDRTMPLEKFSARVLVPAMTALANEVRGDNKRQLITRIKSLELEIPSYPDIEAARVSDKDLSLRGIRTYDIATDTMITRFDILYIEEGKKVNWSGPRLAGPKGFLP